MPANSGKLWLELLGSQADFEKVIMSSIDSAFNAAINGAIVSIKNNLEVLIYSEIQECSELQDLKGGSLRGELGLTSSQAAQAAEEIAKAVSESIVVDHGKASVKTRSGGLDIYIQPSSFANVLSIGNASIRYFSKKYKRPVTLEWLNWLLKEGDRIIVGKFDFEPIAGRGRSGLGSMKKGGSWRVSPQSSGTEDDNFITRALGNKLAQNKMARIIEKAIKANWK